MYMQLRILCLTAAVALAPAAAHAQLSKLLREGIEYAGKSAAKAAREGGEATAKATSKSTGKAAAKVGREAVEAGVQAPLQATARTAGRATAKSTGQVAAQSALRAGAAAHADLLTKQFGSAGAQAAASFSEESAARLVAVSDELAASGRASDWLTLIAERGDAAVQWLWKRRGSIAVGTTATAVLLAPDDFVHASQEFASDSVDAAGKYLVEPLISESAEHVGAPFAREAARSAGETVPWAWLAGFAVAAILLARLRRRMRRRPGASP